MSSSVLKNKENAAVDHGGNGTSEPPESSDSGGDQNEGRNDADDIKKLRKLLVNSTEVGEVLPAAVKNSTRKDNQLANATMPLVEENIRQSVARDPKILAEALFPVIGPAIRKAIAHALNSMVQSFNQTLEYSVSPKGLGWRLEALRTGKSFGEIVMLKTLRFRVEQVFLIHKDTGILLQHVVADKHVAQDGDMVSAMLTAISDFVQDSFGTSEGATLDSLKVKELSVWIEHSPDAVIAGVIRGTPPLDLREIFSESIEEIQFSYENELNEFDGNTDLFEEARPTLNRCLQFQVNQESGEKKSSFKPANILALLSGLILLLVGLYIGWQYWRWTGYLDQLRNEPGIVVAESNFGILRHSVGGLRDPLSRNPILIRKELGFDKDDISENWKSYNDADPKFVLARANILLKPPADVKLDLKEGVLLATGNVLPAWGDAAARLAPALAGVNEFKISDNELLQTIEKIESQSLLFKCNTIDLADDQEIVFNGLVKDLGKILESPLKPQIQILGYATETGPSGANENISKRRAEMVLNEFVAKSEKFARAVKNDPLSITAVAVGETNNEADCKVKIKVTIR